MASKFSEFLQEHNIDERRLLIASKHLERLRPEDRRLRRQKTNTEAAASNDDAPAEPSKARSGRPVTHRLLATATAGGAISGPAKTRLLRAVNRVLEQKKQDPVDLRALF